jgi:hypothetical protein
MKKMFYFILVSALLNCCTASNEKSKGLEFIDQPLSTDCNFYVMKFDKGEIVFRFALSGKCESLTNTLFIEEYQFSLQKNKQFVREGVFIIDYYEEISLNQTDIDKLLKATKLIIPDHIVQIKSTEKERITLSVKMRI